MATPAGALGGSPEPVATPALASGIDSAIDNALSPLDTPPEPEAEAAPQGNPETQPAAEPEAEPDATQETELEAQPESETPPAAEPETDPYEEVKPDKVSDGGKTWHFRETKARSLLAAQDFQRKVQEIIPGASLDSIKEAYGKAVAADEMVEDFDSGDPERVTKFANFFFDQQANPRSVLALVEQLPKRLASSHPQAYQALEKDVLDRTIHRMYDEAARSGDEQLLALAQHLHHRHSGTFYKKEQLEANRDPMLAERQQFDAERKQFYAEKQREMQARLDQRRQEIDALEQSVVTEEIEKALAPVAAQYKDKPAWRHMVRDLMESVENSRKANAPWDRQFGNIKSRALRDFSAESREPVAAMLRQFVVPVIAKQRKAVIDSQTSAVLSASAAAHQKQQAVAARKEAPGSSMPVPRDGVAQKLKQAKSLDEAWGAFGW